MTYYYKILYILFIYLTLYILLLYILSYLSFLPVFSDTCLTSQYFLVLVVPSYFFLVLDSIALSSLVRSLVHYFIILKWTEVALSSSTQLVHSFSASSLFSLPSPFTLWPFHTVRTLVVANSRTLVERQCERIISARRLLRFRWLLKINYIGRLLPVQVRGVSPVATSSNQPVAIQLRPPLENFLGKPIILHAVDMAKPFPLGAVRNITESPNLTRCNIVIRQPCHKEA